MSSSVKLSLDATGVEVDPTLYRNMIGSLFYLTASRLDITFSVGVCARFQVAPKESHLKQSNELFVISMACLTMEFGIQETQMSA